MTGKITLKQPGTVGAPSKITEDVINELKNAFKNGFTITKACEVAGISTMTYYNKCKADPAFLDEMERAQKWVEEKARQNVALAISEGDIATTRWFLERRARREFGNSTELTGSGGGPLQIEVVNFSPKQEETESVGVVSSDEEDESDL